MPVSKQRRSELISEYTEWLKQSPAVILADYQGMATKDLYQLRSKLHEANGALHVVKNTLMIRALRAADLPMADEWFTGSVIAGFCFEDPATIAKAMVTFANDQKSFTLKGGLLDKQLIDVAGLKALADLPPRPILLGGLVATIQGPMSQLINVLNAPMRELAQVLQARSEQAQASA